MRSGHELSKLDEIPTQFRNTQRRHKVGVTYMVPPRLLVSNVCIRSQEKRKEPKHISHDVSYHEINVNW